MCPLPYVSPQPLQWLINTPTGLLPHPRSSLVTHFSPIPCRVVWPLPPRLLHASHTRLLEPVDPWTPGDTTNERWTLLECPVSCKSQITKALFNSRMEISHHINSFSSRTKSVIFPNASLCVAIMEDARHWPTHNCEWSWYRLIWIDLLTTDDDILLQLYTGLKFNSIRGMGMLADFGSFTIALGEIIF
ncbi:hypothetical protein Pmani_018413 [Petrolisthes manimaculis]|uniref:Uncharacterized protein n=1 Tax=Petrolisthes manimaculis TaxID=1843537 RepID=A0AAE1PJT5_9EUCA|nr:hypothetical protein Pmani_018413 [Petrolisthes manimaculis]